MKANLHPPYQRLASVVCACGNSFNVGSTVADLRVDNCSQCHPFFTGEQRFVDTLGRVDKFLARRRAAVPRNKKNKREQIVEAKPKSLKEMLTVTKTDKASAAV